MFLIKVVIYKIETRNISDNTLTDNVTIFIPTLPPTESEFCFIAIGRVGNLTIAVEGSFSVWRARVRELYENEE